MWSPEQPSHSERSEESHTEQSELVSHVVADFHVRRRFMQNPTVLGRAWIFSENRHPFVCFADISPVRGITRPYEFLYIRYTRRA